MWYERTGSVVISEQKNKMKGVQYVYNGRDNIDTKFKGTREPSTEGQSQCDPGLERMVQRDQEAPEIEMDFWKQRLGGDWRLVAAVQQPSLES